MYIIHMCIYRCISYIKGYIYMINFFFPLLIRFGLAMPWTAATQARDNGFSVMVPLQKFVVSSFFSAAKDLGKL